MEVRSVGNIGENFSLSTIQVFWEIEIEVPNKRLLRIDHVMTTVVHRQSDQMIVTHTVHYGTTSLSIVKDAILTLVSEDRLSRDEINVHVLKSIRDQLDDN